MQAVSCREIVETVNGALISGSLETSITGISTDTRNIGKGNLFIPLKGPRFDGHDFIEKAFEIGAAAALTETRERFLKAKVEGTLIKVGDTLKAYGALAANHRKKYSIPFIAVTGSAGKTSTKDMIACVLGSRLRVLKTEANFNNNIGLPSTILKLDGGYDAVVVEMGMRAPGEISYLTRIAKPDMAVITNIGTAHIEKLGSREKIFRAKMEILEGLRYNGLLILNADDEMLYNVKSDIKYRTVFYGISKNAGCRAVNIRSEGESGIRFDAVVKDGRFEVFVPVPGIHNVYNALAAIAAGLEARLAPPDIIRGIAEFIPGEMRMNIINRGNIKIINDAYNANPQSVKAALKVLEEISAGKRSVAVLGDMLELGRFSKLYYNNIGKYAAETGVQLLAATGKYADDIAAGAAEGGMPPEGIAVFRDKDALTGFLSGSLKENDVVLVKASRGMRLEETIEHIGIEHES